MREPLDWLGSWYRYRQRDDVAAPGNSTMGRSFDEFVRAYCSDTPPDFAAVGSQSRFLAEKRGRGVDHLFAYEKIDRFVTFLEARLKIEITLPRLNVSPKGDLRLSPDTDALFRSFCAKDIALYESIST
jgi:hypothetical protein